MQETSSTIQETVSKEVAQSTQHLLDAFGLCGCPVSLSFPLSWHQQQELHLGIQDHQGIGQQKTRRRLQTLNFQEVDRPTCSTLFRDSAQSGRNLHAGSGLPVRGYSSHTGRNHPKFIRISCSRMEVEKQNPGLNSNCRPLLQIISLLAAGPGPIVLQLDQVGARGKLLVKD